MVEGLPSQALYDILRLFAPFLAGSLATLLGVFVRNRIEEKQQKRDEIYRPLFNELSAVSEGDFPYHIEDGEYRSVWDDFDNYQKWSMTDSEQNMIESYVKKLDALNQYTVVLESAMVDMVESSDLLVNEELHHDKPNVGVLMSGPYGDRPKGVMQVGDWVDWFAHPMIVSESPSELREKLLEWSVQQGGGHHLSYREWEEEQFETLFEFVQEADNRIDCPEHIDDRNELVSKTRKEADSIAHSVKKKMDGWF